MLKRWVYFIVFLLVTMLMLAGCNNDSPSSNTNDDGDENSDGEVFTYDFLMLLDQEQILIHRKQP